MRRLLGSVLIGAALVAMTACGDDDDDAEAGGDTSETTDSTEAESDGGGSGTADEYVDAIAASMASGDDELFATDDMQQCAAEAFVEVIGLEALQAAASPEELQALEDDGLATLGIELDDDQAAALVDALNECGDLGEVFAQGFEGTFVANGDPTGTPACLSSGLEDPQVKVIVGRAFTLGDNDDMDEASAEAFYGWLNTCYGMRQMLIEQAAQEVGSPDMDECLAQGISEDLAHRFWIRAFSNSASLDTSPEAGELAAAGEACA